ncbi:MAG: hypothetical protein ACKO26_09420 [Planctomycetota bacterium]
MPDNWLVAILAVLNLLGLDGMVASTHTLAGIGNTPLWNSHGNSLFSWLVKA